MKKGKLVGPLMMIVITAAKKAFSGESKLIGVGEHLVTIKEIKDEMSKVVTEWIDRSVQSQVIFESADGKTLMHWYNQKGFFNQKDEELGFKLPKDCEYRSTKNTAGKSNNEFYAVNKKTNKRLENPAKTEKCMEILGNFAFEAGLEGENELSELIGNEIGIVVHEVAGKLKVHYTKPADQVEEITE